MLMGSVFVKRDSWETSDTLQSALPLALSDKVILSRFRVMQILVVQRFYPTRHMYFLVNTRAFRRSLCIPRKYKWRVGYHPHSYTTRQVCITISYHAIENTATRWESWAWYSWVALIDGKVRWNADEISTAFLYSNWLCFLWYGIKSVIWFIFQFVVSIKIYLYKTLKVAHCIWSGIHGPYFS